MRYLATIEASLLGAEQGIARKPKSADSDARAWFAQHRWRLCLLGWQGIGRQSGFSLALKLLQERAGIGCGQRRIEREATGQRNDDRLEAHEQAMPARIFLVRTPHCIQAGTGAFSPGTGQFGHGHPGVQRCGKNGVVDVVQALLS